MWTDVLYSLRTLRRSPVFTTATILTLALGMGANTAIFSLLQQVVLRSLPVSDPASLAVLHTSYNAPGSSSSDNGESVFSYPMYRQLERRDAAFSGIIARMSGAVRLGTQSAVEPAMSEMVSGNFFAVLGVGAATGRVLSPEDDKTPGAHPVAVLSHSYWVTRFGKSLSILNQTVNLNGLPFQVIGVTEEGFKGVTPGHTPDLYVPIAMQRTIWTTADVLADSRTRWLNLFARLRPGISPVQAQLATDAAYRSILEEELAHLGRMRNDREREEFLRHRAELRPAWQGINGLRRAWEKPLLALMALVGLVLAITCANVASLLLARAAQRQREMAIRLAIGAGRWVLAKQLLTEALILAVSGGLAGLAVAYWCMRALVFLAPGESAKDLSAAMNVPLLLFSLAMAGGCGLLFGLLPALQATRPDAATTLKEHAASVAAGPARIRQGLVIGQLALSLLLIVGAGLFSGSLRNLLNVELGFRSRQLLLVNVNATLSRPNLAAAVEFYRDLQERLSAIPGVAGAGAAASGPFGDGNRGGNLTVEGYHAGPDEYVGSSIVAVSAGFFRTLGIPLRGGREFTDRDRQGAPKTVVVNDAFVKRYFAGRNAMGAHLMFGASNKPVLDREIVGVVPDTHTEVRSSAKATVYLPYAQWEKPERLIFYIRYAGDGKRLPSEVRRVIQGADPNVPVGKIIPLDVKIGESLYTDRLIAILAETFGVLATLLAAIGLYGAVAYSVARRTAEIGIRMALGALPRDVLGMVLRNAGGLAVLGIGIGLGAAFGLSRLVESHLFGIRPADPAVIGIAVATLSMVALVAAFVPAWRASRIDPLCALKYE